MWREVSLERLENRKKLGFGVYEVKIDRLNRYYQEAIL
ncbi:hypothetical protein KIS4809_1394 [Bacillus sp. ZZV12-4809]|nr:hypothetical protein KIS4809_1394 [Bacillus sp. ZZV12-4809]